MKLVFIPQLFYFSIVFSIILSIYLYIEQDKIKELRDNKVWKKVEIVDLFFKMIPGFGHKETGKYLDSKM